MSAGEASSGKLCGKYSSYVQLFAALLYASLITNHLLISIYSECLFSTNASLLDLAYIRTIQIHETQITSKVLQP